MEVDSCETQAKSEEKKDKSVQKKAESDCGATVVRPLKTEYTQIIKKNESLLKSKS